MTEPLQPALFDPEQFPNAELQPVAGPDRRSPGDICVDRMIRISIVLQMLILPTSLVVFCLGGTGYIAFHWLIIGTVGAAISCSLIVGLLKWEEKRRQDSIVKRWNSAQDRIRSWASRAWEERRRRNRLPNPQDNPVPVQDESIVEERRIELPTVAQQTDDSRLPSTSVKRNRRKKTETPTGRYARSVLRAKPNPNLLRARHDSRIPPESTMTRQLQQSLEALQSISGDLETSDPHTSNVQPRPDQASRGHMAGPETQTPGGESGIGLRQPVHRPVGQARQLEGTSVTELPREDFQPSSASEPEGARHGQSMPTELTMITPLQQAMNELATPPILSELAQPVGIPLPQRSRRVTGGSVRQDLETSDEQQPANQEQNPHIPGAIYEQEDPAQGPCPLARWEDI